MAEFKQIIDDALDILKFDGAVQDTLAELRRKWGAQVPALLDERFDAVGVQYMKLSHEKGAAALGQELSAFGWALYNLDDEDEYLSPSTAALLRERKKAALTEWIFQHPWKPEQPTRPSAAYERMKVLLKEAELPDLRFHDLRHTCGQVAHRMSL